ncbi:MAG: histidine phosphatase family protein [Chloroflexota bacterium]|nr:histidine phosphatase family protein [Chloroflexota bacterium]
MSATVLLIRHPESAWNRAGIYQGRRDTPLSSLGRRQAELVTARLSRERLNGIVCSPLRRARSLAQSIGHRQGIEPRVDDRLTEIAHGTWEGLHRHEVQRRFPDQYLCWLERPHEVVFQGGESLADVHQRSLAAIEEVLPRDGMWAVVTHDTVARLIVAAANQEAIIGFSGVALENAAITTLVGPILHGSVRKLNDVSHLGDQRVNLKGQAL